jgi:ERCC4-type nuclease
MRIWASKLDSEVCTRLAAEGIEILPIDDDLGKVEWYVLSERTAVERRTSSSFLDGISDKTLFASAIHLGERFEIAILVVEGDYSSTPYRAFHPQAIRGALSSMLLVYGLSVVATPNADESAALIAMMARQEQGGVPEISLVPKRKAADLADMQRRVVEMLPGCGLTVARELLRHYGSIERIVRASEEELCEVRGVGPKTASRIRRVLHTEYDAVDTERDLEDALAAAPELLFGHEVTLVARQHTIQTSSRERDVIDLVFFDRGARELVLVELKRGALEAAHEAQLERYLAHAHQSSLLRDFLERGAHMRGVLATVTPCDFQPSDASRISACVVDREPVIHVLRQLRRDRTQ